MEKFSISLATIRDIKDFVDLCNEFPNDILVRGGMYAVDGKSLLGILSLDLSKPVVVQVIGDITGENFKLKDFFNLKGQNNMTKDNLGIE